MDLSRVCQLAATINQLNLQMHGFYLQETYIKESEYE